MVGQILINLLAAGAGGIAGLIENSGANKLEVEKIKAESERDKLLATQKQLDSFYSNLRTSDEPKQQKTKRKILWGLFEWETSKYAFAPTPARAYRGLAALLLVTSYSILLLWCGFAADLPIQSFPADPEKTELFKFFGFSLYTSTHTEVYQLTLGGLILALSTPISFTISKWLTGIGFRR